jgi:hypothetical protein
MTDVGFVIAGYGVILGGLGAYAALLLRRLAAARRSMPPGGAEATPPGGHELE